VRKLLRRLRREQDGGAALEFGFIAPAFFMLVWGTIELGLLLLGNTLLEGAVREAARAGLTGYTPTNEDRVTYIRSVVQQFTMGLIDMAKLQIDTKVYSSFANIGQPEPFSDQPPYNGVYDAGEPFVDVNGNGKWDADMGVAGLGGPGDVVVYTLTYPWDFFAGYAQTVFGVPTVTLKASVAIRNEPY